MSEHYSQWLFLDPRLHEQERERHKWITELKKRNRWKRKMRGRHK